MKKFLLEKKSYLMFACLISLIYTIIVFASPSTYYISPSGNDTTGDGSNGNPWQTLYKACESVTSSGDIIHVNPGTYTETQQCNLRVGISIEGEGTNSILQSTLTADWTPMILLSSAEGTDGNQHISNILLDGQDLSTFWAIQILGRSNVSIHDTTIEDFKDRGVLFSGRTDTNDGPPTTYATGNTFYNNVMNNCAAYNTSNGIYGRGCLNIGGQDGMLVYDNVITQNQRPEGYNGWPIKYINDGYLRGVKIYGNTLTKIPYGGTYPGESGWDFAIELFHVSGLEIYDNTIQGSIDLNNQTKGTYDYSVWIHDNTISQQTLNSHYESGIILEFDTDTAIIENNILNNVSSGVIFNTRDQSEVTGITIRNNIMSNIGRATGDGNNGVGIGIYSESTDNAVLSNFYIYNNTILAATGNAPWEGLDFSSIDNGSATNINIRNNIIRGFQDAWLRGGNTTNMNNVTVTHNDVYSNANGNAPNFPGGDPTSYTYSNNVSVDPVFVSSTDFHLQSSSPLIDAGVDVGISYTGSAPDIGYAEYGLSGGNASPSANAGPNQSITLPTDSVLMSASGSDSDGTIASHVWTKFSGPSTYTITDANDYNTTITGLVAGTYVFRLTVTDDDSATASDDISIVVSPEGTGAPSYPTLSPTDKSGTITLSNGNLTMATDGSDWGAVRSTLGKSSGKWYWEVTVITAGSPKIGILKSTDVVTTYIGSSATGYAIDDVGQKWNNGSSASYASSVSAPGTVIGIALDMDVGTISYYINGVSQGVAFSGISGLYYPAISGGFANSNFTVNFGASSFSHTAPDGYNSGFYDLSNVIPSVDAGPNQSITLPTDSVLMSASGSDSDGTIASHVWTKFSGPSTYTITDANDYNTTITGLVAGTYVFRLTVTDTQGGVGRDDVQITVNNAPTPVVATTPSSYGVKAGSIVLPLVNCSLGDCQSTKTLADQNNQHTSSSNINYINYSASVFVVNSLKLNVRSSRDIYSPSLKIINQNESVEILDKNKNMKWLKVRTSDGTIGYVRSKYIQSERFVSVDDGDQAVINRAALNIRKSGTIKSGVVDVLTPADSIDVISVSQDTNWAKIKTIDGIIGFVNKFFLRALFK
jgi:SH3-like domain-containing protein